MDGWVIFVTGLPGSGKTTVSELLKKNLTEQRVRCSIIGIDQIRKKYKLFDYSPTGREKAYGLLVENVVSQVKRGENMITDATAYLRKFRENIRGKTTKFLEVYLKCPLKICMEREFERDAKKAYLIYRQKKWVPGIQVKYEEPENPEIIIETDKKSPEEAVRTIISRLKDEKWA